MATVNLSDHPEAIGNGIVYKYGYSLASASNGDAILLVACNRDVAISIQATGGAKLQATVDTAAEIAAGTEDWIDWPYGAITTEQGTTVSPAVTAVRMVQTAAGTSQIKVSAQGA